MAVGDVGTELTSNAILRWLDQSRVARHRIAPGKSTYSAFTETFNGRLPDEMLSYRRCSPRWSGQGSNSDLQRDRTLDHPELEFCASVTLAGWLRQRGFAAKSAIDCRSPHGAVLRYTTRFENAHRTVLREVLYRYYPWFGCRVCVHGAVDKAGDVAFRCTLDGSQADRWLEVPAWMFDRTACHDAGFLTAQPLVRIDALAALSALLDVALMDRTPLAALLSGASRASHDQNRGETHVTADGNARERIPTQSTTAAADGSVRERPVERRRRRASMAGAAGGSPGGPHEPDDAVDRRPCCDDGDAAREGGRS